MKSLLSIVIAGVLLSGTALVGQAEAGHGKGKKRAGRADVYYDYGYYDHYRNPYFRGRDIVVIRDYYRPYYRPLPPGVRVRYARSGYLPPGWAKRMRPVPVYLEREMVVMPRGYHRGVIDGHAVVYNDRGFILDVAVLF